MFNSILNSVNSRLILQRVLFINTLLVTLFCYIMELVFQIFIWPLFPSWWSLILHKEQWILVSESQVFPSVLKYTFTELPPDYKTWKKVFPLLHDHLLWNSFTETYWVLKDGSVWLTDVSSIGLFRIILLYQ